MIVLTALYRNAPGAHFDFDYYINTHLRLARRLLGEFGMGSFQVERCLQKLDSSPPDYLCISRVEFASLEKMKAGFAAHNAELSADFAAYSSAIPQTHVCELVAPDAAAG